MKKLFFSAMTVALISSCAHQQPQFAETSPMPAKPQGDFRKPNADIVSQSEIAKRYMAVADAEAQAVNSDQQCFYNIYEGDVMRSFMKAVAQDQAIKKSVPDSVKKLLGRSLGYKLSMRLKQDWGPFVKQDFDNVRLFTASISGMSRAEVVLNANNTFVQNGYVWDDAKEDWVPKTQNGQWSFHAANDNAQKPSERQVRISVRYLKDNGKTESVKSYVVLPSGEYGAYSFVKANAYNKNPELSQNEYYFNSGFVSDDSMACGD